MTAALSGKQLQTLKDFNILADRLINSKFFRDREQRRPSRYYTWTRNEKTGMLDFSFARDRIHDEESIMAFVLTMRQFIQDRDPTSISKMAKFYEDMSIDTKYKDEFRGLRKSLNDYLDSPAITTTEDDPTMEQILRTVIYGKYAHMEEAKRQVLEKWKEYEGTWDMIVSDFEVILYRCAKMIIPMKELNEKVLRKYSSS